MATCAQMIAETQGLLQSWVLDESQSTTLSSGITANALTFVVTQPRGIATGVSPGIVEIDQELIYCDSVDNSGNATVPAWGRGYLGTSAAVHATGARVISQPTFPRYWTLQALNETMERMFPSVYATGQVELTTTVPQITYGLPATAQWVLGARWLEPGGMQYWRAVKRWRMSPGGGTHFGDQGITVDVADTMMPGRPIQFLYAAKANAFVNETDDFVAATGFNIGLRDVVCLGAASQMTTALELSRLQISSVEQQNRAQLVAPSAALTSSNFLDKRFQERLMEERKALQRLYPPRVTGAWI